MKKKEKVCPHCNKTLPYEVFVTSWGEQSNSGRYCLACHREREEKEKQVRLQEMHELIEKLQIVYGQYWQHYAAPEDFFDSLSEERDFCPYCGTKFSAAQACNFGETTVHLDHMDPLDKGGEHSIRNTVYCCGQCNIRKGKRSFHKWLEKLEPYYKELSREIYIEKHGHEPEDFVEGCNWGRGSRDTELIPYRSLGDVRSSYPTPIIKGPPSNQPIVINIDLTEQISCLIEEKQKRQESGEQLNLDDFDRWISILNKDKKKIHNFDLFGTRAAVLWNDCEDEIYVVCITSFKNGHPQTAKYDYFGYNIHKKYWSWKPPRGCAERVKEELSQLDYASPLEDQPAPRPA